jgi:hypothetical protein
MSKVDEKAALRFVAFQANLASMCFAFGALLFSVGRGLENGHGGIGLSFDSYADLTCPNNTVVVASNGTNGTVVYNTVNLGDPSLTDCGFQYRFDDSRLREVWEQRHKASGNLLCGQAFAIAGWFFSIAPVAALAKLLDLGHGDAQVTTGNSIVFAFVFTAALTVVEFVSEIGTSQVTEWITSSWRVLSPPGPDADAAGDYGSAMDEVQYGGITAAQNLEMTYIVVQSRSLWLFAMDDIFLLFAMLIAAWLGVGSTTVPKDVGRFGLVVAFFCVLDFSFEVTRFVNWRGSTNSVIITCLMLNFFALPWWLFKVGNLLRNIAEDAPVAATTSIPVEKVAKVEKVAEVEMQ